MKMRLSIALTVLLMCLLTFPVFAYSAWQPESDSTDNLVDLVVELRSAYELAVTNRAASQNFLGDLEDLLLRFEAFLFGSESGSAARTSYGVWSEPVEVAYFNRYAGTISEVGKIVYFRVKGADNGRVWGTQIYTNDSDLSTAAVHAGVLSVDQSGIVAVRILPGQAEYEASKRNGITSNSYGGYDVSYEFVAYDESSLLILNPGHLGDFGGFVGQTLAFQVTGSTAGTVWGTGIYTIDSDLATAAVHAGLVKPGETGIILAEILPGQDSYASSENFGVSSRNFWQYWGSYRLKNPH